VDGYFARALPPGMPCWIVSGRDAARLVELIETGSTYGTEVT
jgi:hypothetical protein